MRLDKFVSSRTQYSRADVVKLVRRGRITVDDKAASAASLLVTPGEHKICVDGTPLAPQDDIYLVMNKPAGVLSARSDHHQPTLFDTLSNPSSANHSIDKATLDRLQIVGRLDKDTTGLILLTSNGQFNHSLTSPQKQCFKGYRVTVRFKITDENKQRIEEGLVLSGEKQLTKPARIFPVEDADRHTYDLYIREGKYHQVKRMIAAAGSKVIALHRQSIGDFELPKELAPGEWCEISKEQRARLFLAPGRFNEEEQNR